MCCSTRHSQGGTGVFCDGIASIVTSHGASSTSLALAEWTNDETSRDQGRKRHETWTREENDDISKQSET